MLRNVLYFILLRIPPVVILSDREKMLKIWRKLADLDPWTLLDLYWQGLLMEHSQLGHMRIGYHFMGNLHITPHHKKRAGKEIAKRI